MKIRALCLNSILNHSQSLQSLFSSISFYLWTFVDSFRVNDLSLLEALKRWYNLKTKERLQKSLDLQPHNLKLKKLNLFNQGTFWLAVERFPKFIKCYRLFQIPTRERNLTSWSKNSLLELWVEDDFLHKLSSWSSTLLGLWWMVQRYIDSRDGWSKTEDNYTSFLLFRLNG